MKTKAKIDFSGYSSGELGGIALNIKEQLTVNSALFAGLPYLFKGERSLFPGY